MRYAKVQLTKDIIEGIESVEEESVTINKRIDVIKVILKLITEGYYDDVLKENAESKRRISMPAGLSKKTNEYIREFGYSRMNDVLRDILIEEATNERTDFDEEYYRIMKEEKNREDEADE
ncbi:hypothetical protein K4Q72_12075 [Staphylococcus epidermidis]|nr:hypothetical protein [Staphylococcus epidermidis]